MTIVKWKPMRDLLNIQEEMDRFVNDFFQGTSGREMREGMWSPAVDISENEDGIVVSAEVPGMKKEEISISIQNNVLILKGEKQKEEEKKEHNYHRIERAYGSFQRSFSLPATVDANKVKAAYKDGVLKIELPKKEEAKPKEISINVD